MNPKCVFCNDDVDPKQGYRKVTGWEQRRAAGGTNAVRLREASDQWACRWCIEKQAKGQHHAQTGMFG